jgi:hypothetical protein
MKIFGADFFLFLKDEATFKNKCQLTMGPARWRNRESLRRFYLSREKEEERNC